MALQKDMTQVIHSWSEPFFVRICEGFFFFVFTIIEMTLATTMNVMIIHEIFCNILEMCCFKNVILTLKIVLY